ncbi:MAG: PVC-type heme-binding CxxCH protein [Verrucomicrobiota bacterium]
MKIRLVPLPHLSHLLSAFVGLSILVGSAHSEEPPTLQVHHPDVENVSLFAENPDIVTPIGIAVAPDGRVFVQENHTHKRGKDYEGPEADRILVFEDSDGDGVAEKRSVFYDGLVHSTDLLFGQDGHLYVSTRWFIGRFPNAATLKEAAGDPEVIVECKTEGDYPHNGVGGLAIDPAYPDTLAFGFGENLGADYTFVGSDGTELSGGGEGGSTYRCQTDGSGLQRVSTGHWNAFGMCYDLDGNLFSTDNDPNSTPPNRLLHIIPGSDYGYEYRYGRSGRHPLVDWYGRNPGTLGMIGALGEAACGVIPFGLDHLLTASWTDNRVDLHPLSAKGASFAAGREPFISGPDDFRPVHFSYTADGKSLYITDWVSLSYPVHGQGRIWKVTFKNPVAQSPRPRQADEVFAPELSLEQLGDEDPYVRTAAIEALVKNPDILTSFDWKSQSNPLTRAHYAVALKRAEPAENATIIPELLEDDNSDVRYVGIKWIADERLNQYRDQLAAQLDRNDLKRRDLLAVVAALAEVSGDLTKEFSPGDTLLELALDESKLQFLRSLALHGVPVDHPGLTVSKLRSLAGSKGKALQREAVRTLAVHPDASREGALLSIANDESLDETIRADAVAGLAAFASEQQEFLTELADSPNSMIAKEAKRTLASAGLMPRDLDPKPLFTDLSGWETLLDEVPGEPNLATGRRLFFHSRLATCANCHAMNGRGLEVGPDLTTIAQQAGGGRSWLLTHILDPNAEVAPYFRPQMITTKDGQTRMGFILGKEGKAQGYIGPDGKTFSVLKADVTAREELPISLMPPGLLTPLNASEVRDLLSYILAGGR